jgi:hypothetical protein
MCLLCSFTELFTAGGTVFLHEWLRRLFIYLEWTPPVIQKLMDQAPVAHACNPSYSGGRDQKDCSLKPVGQTVHKTPSPKKPITKIGLVEWLKGKALSSNPSTTKKK